MKKIVSINDYDMLNNLSSYVDGFVVGIKDYSINYPCFSMEEINKIIDYCNINNKEIFVVLNKNIHDKEIENVKQILSSLHNITGLFYYDNAILNLKDKLNLKYDLVLDQEHIVTNYNSINLYNDLGVKYAKLSTDITLKEAIEIQKNSKSKIIVTVFSILPMFASQRHLVKNYLNKFNLKDNSKINYMEKEGAKYKVIDDLGTCVYTDSIYSILDELDNIDFDYIFLNSFLIDDFTYVVENISDPNINKKYNTKPYFKEIETVYKVK